MVPNPFRRDGRTRPTPAVESLNQAVAELSAQFDDLSGHLLGPDEATDDDVREAVESLERRY